LHRIRIRERPDWRAQAERHGFHFHTLDGAPYWDESAYYAFTLEQIERDIEAPTEALHALALELVEEVVGSEALLARLAIPPAFRDYVRDSWRRGEPQLYGRLDFAYDGRGPAKLYELNYDTPTALYEAAFFQWLWLEDRLASGDLPRGSDQFNALQEALVEAFGTIAPGLAKPLYFSAVRDAVEDQGTIAYLRDCAHQAGLDTRTIAIEDIGLSADGRFTDLDDRVIRSLFKLYPLEYLFEESFGAALPRAGVQLIEPAWKAILSNKGILPLLWERHPGHPNLLEAHFADDPRHALAPGWVRKPFFSREGSNVAIALPDGGRLETGGPDGEGPCIVQRFHPLPEFDGNFPLIGSWLVADRAAGMGLREDRSRITQDSSRFVPHAIVPAPRGSLLA
jgi:glutathionylspermidine synthase